jgi:hypothetical protein
MPQVRCRSLPRKKGHETQVNTTRTSRIQAEQMSWVEAAGCGGSRHAGGVIPLAWTMSVKGTKTPIRLLSSGSLGCCDTRSAGRSAAHVGRSTADMMLTRRPTTAQHA